MWPKEQHRAYNKAYTEAHKEQSKAYYKTYIQEHKEQIKAYYMSDLNKLGQTKANIRSKSKYYISKYGKKIKGYEIHHCFGYEDAYKFIYISKSLHLKIHQYLRDNNISADSDHYEQIKHLLDDTVVKYGID